VVLFAALKRAKAMNDKGLSGTTSNLPALYASNLPALSTRISLFDRVWPPAAILVGLTITAAWVGILGYGLFELVF
jgi:hypothetical protein